MAEIPRDKKHALFRPQKTDRRFLTLLSNILVDSKLSAKKSGCDSKRTPVYYLGESGHETDHSCCNHQYRCCSLGNPLQRLILAIQHELHYCRLELRQSIHCNTILRAGHYANALGGALDYALKLEAQRSYRGYGHTVKISKDNTSEITFVTPEDATKETTIELYLLLGPKYNGSKGFWMVLEYRDLLRDDRTLSFERLVNLVWSKLKLGLITFRIWDHAGHHIVNDSHLTQSIGHAVETRLRAPRWRLEGTGKYGFSAGCFCCVYTSRRNVEHFMGSETGETSNPSWYGYSSEDTNYTDCRSILSGVGLVETKEDDNPGGSAGVNSSVYSDIYSVGIENSGESDWDVSIRHWLSQHPEVYEGIREKGYKDETD